MPVKYNTHASTIPKVYIKVTNFSIILAFKDHELEYDVLENTMMLCSVHGTHGLMTDPALPLIVMMSDYVVLHGQAHEQILIATANDAEMVNEAITFINVILTHIAAHSASPDTS